MPKRNAIAALCAVLAVLAVAGWMLLESGQEELSRGGESTASVDGPTPDPAMPAASDFVEVVPTEAPLGERTQSRASLAARRFDYDYEALPFPFRGRCVANGSPVAGATVHYQGDTRTTDQHGRFSFPRYAYARRVIVEAEGHGQLVTHSIQSNLTIQMQPPAIGRVIARYTSGRVEDAKVTVYLLPETVKVHSERFLLKDLPIMGEARTDANGLAFIRSLPTFDDPNEGRMMLYCKIEFPDGSLHEGLLIPRKRAVSRGPDRVEWSLDYVWNGEPAQDLRVERRNEFGNRVPVPNQMVYFRANAFFKGPWHAKRTDAFGVIPLSNWGAKNIHVEIPISKNLEWSSLSDPLIDMGRTRIALLPELEQSVHLVGAPTDLPIQFQIQGMAGSASERERAPRSLGGTARLSNWGWQDCAPNQHVRLTSGWAGKNMWAWVRVQPGGWVIASKKLEEKGVTELKLPRLSRLVVKAGEGQRFPLATRVWLTQHGAQNLPPLILDPRGAGSVEGIVPYGQYRASLVKSGSSSREIGNLHVNSAEQELRLDFPQEDSTLALFLGEHRLSKRKLRIDGESAMRQSNAQGEIEVRGSSDDSFLLQIPGDPTMQELELIGRPELLFLGYEAYLEFSPGPARFDIPLGSLFFEAHTKDAGKVRITRRNLAGEYSAWVELPLPEVGSVLARTLPTGKYRIETRERTLEVEILPLGRVQVGAEDR